MTTNKVEKLIEVIAEVKATSGKHLHGFYFSYTSLGIMPVKTPKLLTQSQLPVLHTFNMQHRPDLVRIQSLPSLVVLLPQAWSLEFLGQILGHFNDTKICLLLYPFAWCRPFCKMLFSDFNVSFFPWHHHLFDSDTGYLPSFCLHHLLERLHFFPIVLMPLSGVNLHFDTCFRKENLSSTIKICIYAFVVVRFENNHDFKVLILNNLLRTN